MNENGNSGYENSPKLDFSETCVPSLKQDVKLSCPALACPAVFSSYNKLDEHATAYHNISMTSDDLVFNSIRDFKIWKENIEQEYPTLFLQNCKDSDKDIFKVYSCRGGVCKDEGEANAIRMKYCPSRINVAITNKCQETIVLVKYWNTHYGHYRKPYLLG